MNVRFIQIGETNTAALALVFDLRQLANPLSPATGEAGGQPSISLDGAAWTTTGIGTLTRVGSAGGIYQATLASSVVAAGSPPRHILSRYVSANVPDTQGTTALVGNFPADVRSWLGDAVIPVRTCDVSTLESAGGTADVLTAVFRRNGAEIAPGSVTSPTIQLVNVATGSNLWGSAKALLAVGSTNALAVSVTSGERLVAGDAYTAVVTATIDGSSRTFTFPLSSRRS